MNNVECTNNNQGKTVIVFSTYRNYPIGDSFLFNNISADQQPMTGELLCSFFWKRLTNDVHNGQDMLNKLWNMYLNEDGKKEIEKDITSLRKKYLDNLYEFIRNDSVVNNAFPGNLENFSFIDYPIWKAGKISPSFKSELSKFKKHIDAAPVEVIKEKKGTWISQNLKINGQQDAYDTKFASGYNQSSPELRDKPLLSYRFSYYRLKDSSDKIEIYAIWPLDAQTRDGGKEWINALSEQFGKGTDRLYLVLHDKDIKDIAFNIYSYDFYEQAERFVILFQHDNRQIGSLLKTEHTAKEIGEYMERIRNYYLLNEACNFLDNCDYDNLFNCCNKLPDKYMAIKKDAENLIKMPENSKLFSDLEDKIVNEIGKTRP